MKTKRTDNEYYGGYGFPPNNAIFKKQGYPELLSYLTLSRILTLSTMIFFELTFYKNCEGAQS